MNTFEEDLVDSLEEGKAVHFSQLGSIQELSLSQLRDQIKKVMIPLLIKAFRYQMDLVSSSHPVSHEDLDASVKEAYEQLKTLDHDLHNLQLWCQSCRSQIERALHVSDEEQKNIVATTGSGSHPGIGRSFLNAIRGQSCTPDRSSLPRGWWKSFLKKR